MTVAWIGLLVTLTVFVPLMLYALHSLWRTARTIQSYAREALTGTAGMAEHSRDLQLLDQTVRLASEIRSAAASVACRLDVR